MSGSQSGQSKHYFHIFKQFLSLKYIQSIPFEFEQMAKYYTKEANSVLDEIVLLLVEVIQVQDCSRNYYRLVYNNRGNGEKNKDSIYNQGLVIKVAVWKIIFIFVTEMG